MPPSISRRGFVAGSVMLGALPNERGAAAAPLLGHGDLERLQDLITKVLHEIRARDIIQFNALRRLAEIRDELPAPGDQLAQQRRLSALACYAGALLALEQSRTGSRLLNDLIFTATNCGADRYAGDAEEEELREIWAERYTYWKAASESRKALGACSVVA